jgi:hypothetical protein
MHGATIKIKKQRNVFGIFVYFEIKHVSLSVWVPENCIQNFDEKTWRVKTYLAELGIDGRLS